jgi:uncharacterized repeat protein (TIGR01451 family)
VKAQDTGLEFGELQIESKVIEPALLGNTSDLLITLTNIGSAEVFNSTIIMHLPSGLSLKEGISIDKRIDTDVIYPTYRGIDYENPGYNYKLLWSNIADLRPGESVSVAVRLNVAGMPDLFIGDVLSLMLKGEASQTPIYLVSDEPDLEVEDEFDLTIEGFTVDTEPSDQSEIVTGTTEETRQERIVEINSNSEVDSKSIFTIREILSEGIEIVRDSISLKLKTDGTSSENIEHSFTESVNDEGSTVLEWTLTKLMKDLPVRLSYLFGIKKSVDGEVIQHNSLHIIENETSTEYIGRDEESISESTQNSDAYIAKYIRITKTPDKKDIQPGDIVTYTVNVQTSEYYDFSNIIVKDVIPDGMLFVSSKPVVAQQPTIPLSDGPQEVEWNIGILEKNQTFTFTYKTYVSEIYESGDEVLSNDKFNNKIEVVGDWSDSMNEGTVDDLDSEITPIQRPKVKMQIWNPRVGDWKNSIRSNTGYDVRFKIESTFPNYVPSKEVSLIAALHKSLKIYPESIQLFINESPISSPTELTLNNESTLHYQSEEVNSGTKIRIEFTANIKDDSGLQNWDALRNLTRLTYHNSEDERFNSYGQSSLYIENPDLDIEINDNAKYTRTDLIKRYTDITVPDTSFENYVRYKYCESQSGCKDASWTDWMPRNEKIEQEFDFLIRPDVTGEKNICAQVKDQLDHESKVRCDSIIYDTVAPVGTLNIEHLSDSFVSLNVEFSDPILDDGVQGSGISKVSITADGQNRTTYDEVSEGYINIESFDTGIQYGQVMIYMILEDNAGNISDPIQKSILISSPEQPGLPLYVIEYDIHNQPSSIVNSSELFTISMDVKNKGMLVWQPMDNRVSNPVNISYHWINAVTLETFLWNGNRALLSHSVQYNETHENIELNIVAPDLPGQYILQIDAVHEGTTWFSLEGNSMPTYTIEVVEDSNEGEFSLPPYEGEDDFGYGYTPPQVSGISNISTSPLTLYNAPDQNFDYSAIAPRNVPYTILDEQNVNGTLWQSIELQDGRSGWIPVGESLDESNHNLYIRGHICQTRSIELRFSPVWSSNIVTVLQLGVEVIIIDRASRSDGTWIQVVSVSGYTGWISEQFICEGVFSTTEFNTHENDFFRRPYENPSIAPVGNVNIDPDGDGYYDVPITSDFGERWGRFHTGVDYGLYCGTDILASADGVVIEAFTEGVTEGNDSILTTPGNYIVIRHEMNGNTYESLYWHLDEVYVTVGQGVEVGEKIATSGNTGYVRGNSNNEIEQQGCHLHFEIRRVSGGGVSYPIDPELMLQYGEVDSPAIIEIGEAYDLELGVGAPISKVVSDILKGSVRVHRFLNTTNGGHIYTVNQSEINALNGLSGWSYEGIAFIAGRYDANRSKCSISGMVPLYRFRNINNGAHFFTASQSERSSVLQNPGFEYEGIGFCVLEEQVDGAVRIFRFFNDQNIHHFYTGSEKEAEALKNNPTWVDEGVAFYAVSVEMYGMYRLDGIGKHFYWLFEKYNGVAYCDSFKYNLQDSEGKFVGDLWFNPIKDTYFIVLYNYGMRNAYYNKTPDECVNLGLPVMNVAAAAKSQQDTEGLYQFFERGAIYYNNSEGDSYSVYGQIFNIYENIGDGGGMKGSRSKWGFPIGSQYMDGEKGEYCQEFEGGEICVDVCREGESWDTATNMCKSNFVCTTSPYKLPWLGGASKQVSQDADNPSGTHNDYYNNWAWDFSHSIGDAVVASEDGEVIFITDDISMGGCGAAYGNANKVVIRNNETDSSIYLHLAGDDKILVDVGDRVKRGQVIGEVAISGYVCGVHLHYSQIETNSVELFSNGYGRSTKSSFNSPSVCNQIYGGNPQYYHPETLVEPYPDVTGDGLADPYYRPSYISDNF